MANDAVQLEFLLAGLRDTSGNPLVGGKVHTYEAGTTTDKTTWEDADKAVAEDNPIILDGNGQKEVFADGLYNITVKDSDDVTLYTWEYLEFQKGFRDTAETIAGVKTFSDGILTDTIGEVTGGAGVTADGVLLKDNDAYVDAIEEKTSGAGVNIDTSGAASVLIKDGVISADTINEKTVASGVTVEGVLHKDNDVDVPAAGSVITDTIAEKTAANGVDIDGLTIKDGKLNTADSVVTSNITNLAVTEAKLGNSSIVQGKLNTSTGSVNTSGAGNLTLPGGSYGFYPQLQQTGGGGSAQIGSSIAALGSYTANIYLNVSGGNPIYAQQVYMDASPPYKIGSKTWGHFLFLLRKLGTGEVISSYECSSPPWGHNGALWLHKDDPRRIEAVPHPFADYFFKDPTTDGLEICLVDLNGMDTDKWIADNRKLGKTILKDLAGKINPGSAKDHSQFGLNVPGFTGKVKIRLK